jgi:hypothetical protein
MAPEERISRIFMHSRLRLVAIAAALVMSGNGARAEDLWSATLYAGPATNTISSEIIAGHLHVDGMMIGVAVDRKLVDLGSGFSLGAEVQLTQYLGDHAYNTGALGVGVRFDRFPWRAPTVLSLYTGPSYATDPPLVPMGHRKALLNYVGVEFAVALPHATGWDAALRLYHRSGEWGLYSNDIDEGTMVGVGLRYQF